VFGAIEVSTGRWVYRLGRRCAADFMALLDQVLRAFPRSPVIAVICDNDSIHHARKVTAYLVAHPRLELLYGARYSPHDNPAERIWAALTNYLPILPFPGRSGSGRSTPSSASAHPARCWPPPRPGPAPGYRPVISRTSGMRLVGAVLVEIHDEWQVGERRYLSEGSMALLIKPPASSEELATPALLKAQSAMARWPPAR
jgi:hypothetical protein